MHDERANEGLAPEDVDALVGTARLFGELALYALDREDLARLQDEGLRAGLAALGVVVPEIDLDAPEAGLLVEDLAEEHRAAFVAPPGGGAAPVASAWVTLEGGRDVAAEVADLAALAGVEFQRGAARAAPDHLGCLFLLWAEAASSAPAIADVLAMEHLAWADEPLARIAAGRGFYASVAGAARELVATLVATRLTA